MLKKREGAEIPTTTNYDVSVSRVKQVSGLIVSFLNSEIQWSIGGNSFTNLYHIHLSTAIKGEVSHQAFLVGTTA